MNLRYCLILVMMLCSGCATMNMQNQNDKLNASLREYGSALRWGYYKHAYGYHVTRDGNTPQVNFEKLEDFSVTGYEVIEKSVNEDGTEAEVLIKIGYYDEQYGTLNVNKQKQLWWFNKEHERWFTEADFPEFK
jgi:hypothetical protein